MILRIIIPALLALTLGNCTQFPALDKTVTPELEAASYPALVPLGPVLAKAEAGRIDPASTQAGLQSRVASLRTHAARLRGSVLSGPARLRLEQGLR